MALRTYANAPATTLASGCTNVQTTIEVVSTTGLPITYPFILILDRGTGSEEVVLCTNASGTTLTVTRGYDSTTAFAHNVGSEVVHGISAIDPREANTHVNATSNVHGVTGSLVGATQAQTLTNKTISVDSNTVNGLPANNFVLSDGTGKVDGVNGKNIPSGSVVGTTDVQTLTNKNLTSGTNTFPDFATGTELSTHEADTTAHGATGAVVGTTNTQTLTNKTLTSTSNVFPTFVAQVTYAASGTFTKASYPFAKYVRVRVVGAGGAGGAAPPTGAGESSVGAGGGAGGYTEEFISVASLASSETVTVGAGGGGDGGTSSFGAHCSASGGTAGTGGTAGSGPASLSGGAGGSASGGAVNCPGASGASAFRPDNAPGASFSGAGAPSYFGGGGISRTATGAGAAGTAGAGGSGAKNGASEVSTRFGGAGGDGRVIVEIYA